MKIVLNVPEVVTLFKKIVKDSGKFFQMMRFNEQEEGSKFLNKRMKMKWVQFLRRGKS